MLLASCHVASRLGDQELFKASAHLLLGIARVSGNATLAAGAKVIVDLAEGDASDGLYVEI